MASLTTVLAYIYLCFKVVNMQFEGGGTVQFTMVACTKKICERQVKVFGSKVCITYKHSLNTSF